MKKLLLPLLMIPFMVLAAPKKPKAKPKFQKVKCTRFLKDHFDSAELDMAVDKHRYLVQSLPMYPTDLQAHALMITDFNPEAIKVLFTIKSKLSESDFLEFLVYHLPNSIAVGENLPRAFKLSGENPDLFFQMVLEDDFEFDELISETDYETRLFN